MALVSELSIAKKSAFSVELIEEGEEMKIGMMELIVIFVVALVVLGPEKMPYYTKKAGQLLGQLKGYSNKLAEDIKENIVDPLEETTAPLKEAVEPLTSLKKEIEQPLKDVQKSISEIGKPKPEETKQADDSETAETKTADSSPELSGEESGAQKNITDEQSELEKEN